MNGTYNMWNEKLLLEIAESLDDNHEITKEYNRRTGDNKTYHATRTKLRRLRQRKTFNERTDDIIDNKAGLYWSRELLEAMGLDPNGDLEFDTATVNRWWLDPKSILDRIRNGQIKIRVKKKQFVFDYNVAEKLLERAVKPVTIPKLKVKNDKTCLEINLADLHCGYNTLEYYLPFVSQIIGVIEYGWDKIIITTGGDMFHVNDFKGRTKNDTVVGTGDMLEDGWDIAYEIIRNIFEKAIEHSNVTKHVFIMANHDEVPSWFLAKTFEKAYPQIKHDISRSQWKHYTYGNVFVGVTHGDLGKFKDFPRIFTSLFRDEIAGKTTVEVHSQDKHHEKLLAEYGVTTRQVSSPSLPTQWEVKNGYITNPTQRYISLFAYDEYALRSFYPIYGDMKKRIEQYNEIKYTGRIR